MFGDIFSGGQRGRSQVFRGADLRYELELDLEQAVFGTETEIQIPSLAECKTCKGTGAAKGSTPKTCDTCNGQGQVRVQQSIFTIQQPCPRCKGRGKIISNPCDTCYGQGRVRQEKTLPVTVPAGVDTGDRIRVNGEGEAGRNGGPAGDLYVEMRVREHAIFEREGSHLSCEVPISFTTAALGGSVEVPTLDGEVVLKIPSETQSGRVFRVREKGRAAGARRRRRRPVLPGGDRDAGRPRRGAKRAAEEVRGLAAARAATSRASSRSSRASRNSSPARSTRAVSPVPGLAVFGITGRMGQSLVRALREQSPHEAGAASSLHLSGALASAASPRLGQDAALEGRASGVTITADARAALAGAAVAVDFSLPQCVARACGRLRRVARAPAGRHHRLRCRIARAARGRRENHSRADRAEYQHRRGRAWRI